MPKKYNDVSETLGCGTMPIRTADKQRQIDIDDLAFALGHVKGTATEYLGSWEELIEKVRMNTNKIIQVRGIVK